VQVLIFFYDNYELGLLPEKEREREREREKERERVGINIAKICVIFTKNIKNILDII